MANSYTFQIIDPGNLVSAAMEASIAVDAQYVIGLVSRYISWNGILDFAVEIRPGSELTWSDADGLLPSIAQTSWTGSAWTNDTLTEALTGIDPNPGRPDAGLTIYLADDGTIRNYGNPVWFDPNPVFEINSAVPAGMHDFVGILTHEIFHSLGFISYTQEWAARMVAAGDISYFTGARSGALFGGAIPFRTGFDHYGYAQDPSIPINRGLMYEFGNYQQNRFDIGRIDLAMLADMGYAIKTYDGLSLFEFVDTATNLTGTGAGEALYGDYHSNILTGLGGNDRLDAGAGNDQLSGGDGNDLLMGGPGVDSFDGGGNLTDDPVTVYGDRISFAEPRATQGAVADLRNNMISNDGFGNAETMVNIESLGAGTAFADTFHGNDGRNALVGSRGDTLNGHGGDDIVVINSAPASTDGGTGTDRLELFSAGGFYLPDSNGDGLAEPAPAMPGSWQVNLASGFALDGYGNLGTVAGIENVGGSAASDVLTGDDNSNVLKGNGGGDYLSGGGGGDTLEGGEGNDEMDGGSGHDSLRGEAGDDRLVVTGIGMETVSGGANSDTLTVDYGDSVTAITMAAPTADPDGGNAGSIGDGAVRNVDYSSIEIFAITTGSGNDLIRGGTGRNYVELDKGDDRYVAGGTFNSVDGGAGLDGLSIDLSARVDLVIWNLVTGSHNLGEQLFQLRIFRRPEHRQRLRRDHHRQSRTATTMSLSAPEATRVILWNGEDVVNGGAAGAGRPPIAASTP